MGDGVKIVLGTMTYGSQVNVEEAITMTNHFIERGYQEIDTAYVYNEGKTEECLGEVLQTIGTQRVKMATKVNPRVTGRLDAEAIRTQLFKSLERMKLEKVDMLYLHYADPHTSLIETYGTCAELHSCGKFDKLGVSNFPPQMVEEAWELCERKGWPVPVVYQGMYNALTRKAESELLPTIRKLGMHYYAYNPLAGGILAGKYSDYSPDPELGRFTYMPNYIDRFWKKSYFKAYQVIKEKCNENDISVVEASFRWLAYHSALAQGRGDGIIIGASSARQLEQNLAAFDEGKLPSEVVDVFEIAWEMTREDSPACFRFTK